MEDFVARTSRLRTALMVLGALAFVAAGIWMAGLSGPPPVSRRMSIGEANVIGWVSIVFFGSCALAGAKLWWDNSEQLRIGRQGVIYYRWSKQLIPWSEITNVTEWTHKGQRMIILHIRQPILFPGSGIAGILARANRALTGGDISISLTPTDRSFDDAMAAIRRFRNAL